MTLTGILPACIYPALVCHFPVERRRFAAVMLRRRMGAGGGIRIRKFGRSSRLSARTPCEPKFQVHSADCGPAGHSNPSLIASSGTGGIDHGGSCFELRNQTFGQRAGIGDHRFAMVRKCRCADSPAAAVKRGQPGGRQQKSGRAGRRIVARSAPGHVGRQPGDCRFENLGRGKAAPKYPPFHMGDNPKRARGDLDKLLAQKAVGSDRTAKAALAKSVSAANAATDPSTGHKDAGAASPGTDSSSTNSSINQLTSNLATQNSTTTDPPGMTAPGMNPLNPTSIGLNSRPSAAANNFGAAQGISSGPLGLALRHPPAWQSTRRWCRAVCRCPET